MPREQWENDILMEMEGLDVLIKLFDTFEEVLGQLIEEYAEYLDENLVIYLMATQYSIATVMNGTIEWDETIPPVPGLVKQYDDVADEVQVFQAGLKTKGGVLDEED